MTMKNDFIERKIIATVRSLLCGKVNEILNDIGFFVPLVEFGDYSGNDVVTPYVRLGECERTEKERIILVDAYSLTVTFPVPESDESELFCYVYGSALCKAIEGNPTLDGIVDCVKVTDKKYVPPKHANCGENWEILITLRITKEGINNVC